MELKKIEYVKVHQIRSSLGLLQVSKFYQTPRTKLSTQAQPILLWISPLEVNSLNPID